MKAIRENTESKIGVGRLCMLFGKSRQAYYDRARYEAKADRDAYIVLELVAQIRRELPGLGTHKIYRLLREPLRSHCIKMGRDKLHQLLTKYGLTIARKRKGPKTTYSRHWLKKYPNLIREMEILRPEAVWVSDITYICVGFNFSYLSLITDAYSRLIIGHYLHTRLDTDGPLRALEKAVSNRSFPDAELIHHSDRGVQYCSYNYVSRLKEAKIIVSMTEQKDPYENAIAERVNGILKTEFGLHQLFMNHDEAKLAVDKSIIAYNHKRPHMSIDLMTPIEAHKGQGKLKKHWKKKGPFKPKHNE